MGGHGGEVVADDFWGAGFHFLGVDGGVFG